MILTQEDGIEPGIYRAHFGYVNGVPGVREPEFESQRVSTISKELKKEDSKSKRTFFPSIKDFMDTWRKGYETDKSQFGENPVYEKLGFELFYVNWKPGSEFFSFGDHEGIKHMGDRADLEPIMILGDNNGMNDQKGYLNLGVNDFRTQKVLVYRELNEHGFKVRNEGSIDLTPNTEKELKNDLHYYVWEGQDTFPFNPPNHIKSMGNMWTAIGIDPLEIYGEVESMGFVFPK